MEHYSDEAPVNIGWGTDISIAELARMVADVSGFKGELRFNPDRPDGTPRKLLDISRLTGLGWRPKISLASGLAATCQWYREHRQQLRQ
jgi:GDP-L-fucose synthase